MSDVAATEPAAQNHQQRLEVLLEPEREAIRAILVGDLDLSTAPTLDEELGELVDAGFKRVILDLRRLEFMDSTGLHLVIRLHERARREGWELSIVQGPPAIRRLFELTATVDRLPFVTPGHR